MADVGLSSKIVILACFCWNFSGVLCRPDGAPISACVSMLPGHSGVNEQPLLLNPFTLGTDFSNFTASSTVTVTLSGSIPFQGLLLQARLVNTTSPVGVFTNPLGGTKTLTCTTSADSVTHSTSDTKMGPLSFRWIAPALSNNDIEFVATVAHTKEIFWRQIKSSILTALGDVCEPNPCYNGGTCYRHSEQRSFFCGCPDSSNTNPRCEDRCAPSPCINGGLCYKSAISATRYFCLCPTRYQGIYCQIEVDACSSRPCLNGGSCQVSGDTYICLCPVSYQGDNCETDPCRANPCTNGGSCIQVGDTVNFTCACVDGFEGDRCQITSNPCQSIVCMNGGTCVTDQSGFSYCQCSANFAGSFCDIRIHPCDMAVTPCLNEGICYKGGNLNYACSCTGDYTGSHCETRVTPCSSSPCMNGGSCQLEAGDFSYVCMCPPEYSGDKCQNPVNSCASSPCMNGGSCQLEADSSYVCMCPAEYSGDKCQNPGACFGVICQNGGTCIPQMDQSGYTCQCMQSYDGPNCQYSNMCELNDLCANGATCVYNGMGQFQCNCPDDATGIYCMDQTCSSRSCRNGGTCIPTGGGNFRCQCKAVYSGADCSIYTNPCLPPSPCEHGTCRVVIDSASGWECDCDANYMGVNCSIYSGNPCDVFECLNNGECISNGPSASCACTVDYSGLHCEIPINIPPTFTGCPSGVNPSFPLQPGTDTAYLDLTITATDSQSQTLPLVTTDGLQFPSSVRYAEEYRDGKQIHIEATDSDGRTSTCEFKLRLYDDENPSVNCPSDVSAITTEDSVAVSFPIASASDNLQIAPPLQYTPQNGSMFKADSNTVIVKAFDTFSNQGECQFKVVVYKKVSDCPSLTSPVNGVSTCIVDGEQRKCAITCNDGFGNAVGTEEYMCRYTASAYWEPRPNMDICVTFKPGIGVSKTVSIEFTIDSKYCNQVNFDNSVQSSLTSSLQAVGVCTSSISCTFRAACENDGSRRRKRATTDVMVEVDIMSQTGDGESTVDVSSRLDNAVTMVMQAASNGLLSINVDGQITSNKQTTLDASENTWHCRQGQKSSPDGCLSCPPGTSHDVHKNTCGYCDLNTYQNKPEQTKCMECPEGMTTELTGAYSVQQCGAVSEPQGSPWTPTLIGIIAGAGGLIVLLLVILLAVYVIKISRRPSQDGSHSSKTDPDGPLSNFTHLNRAYELEEGPEMLFHGGESQSGQTTYQNVIDDDVLDTDSTDHLVRIPSLSQYSDYYATLNGRSAVTISDSPQPPQTNGGPLSPPPPPPPPPAPPLPDLNTNNSNMRFQNGTAKLHI